MSETDDTRQPVSTDDSTMTIIVRVDAYDQVITPLAYAYLGSAVYDEVNVLFVNWAVRLLSEDGLEDRLSPASADRGLTLEDLKASVEEGGFPPELEAIVAELGAAEEVNLYGCSRAARVFDVPEEKLIPEADGIEGATWFLTEKAENADLFLQF